MCSCEERIHRSQVMAKGRAAGKKWLNGAFILLEVLLKPGSL